MCGKELGMKWCNRGEGQNKDGGAHDVTKKQKEMQVLLDFAHAGCIVGKQAFPTQRAA